MMPFYNHEIFLLFIGGLFSVLLTASVIFLKQKYKRAIQRERYKAEAQANPEAIGDVEAKLNDTHGYENPNLLEEMAAWGMQPLLIISFASLFTQSSELEIICMFLVVILILFHEFYLSALYSKRWAYQLLILGIWIFFFGMISSKANNKKKEKGTISTIATDQRI